MSRKVKRILIISGSVIVVLVAVAAGMLTMMNKLMQKEVKKMTPLDTQEVVEGVLAINDEYVNMYIVKHESGYIGIDAGNSKEAIQTGLEKFNISADQVTDIFLTHSDTDHVGALELFPEATVYLSEKEEQMVNGKTNRFFVFKNRLKKEHTLLKDQQILNIGGLALRIIHVPGHTPGSMCIIVNEEKAFTGDALSLKDGFIKEFTPMFTMDMKTHLQSIEALKETVLTKVKYVFSAHHGYLELNK